MFTRINKISLKPVLKLTKNLFRRSPIILNFPQKVKSINEFVSEEASWPMFAQFYLSVKILKCVQKFIFGTFNEEEYREHVHVFGNIQQD